MSTNFFSSLSGNFDYVSSMSGLLSDYSSIKNGSYGTLMKSYVNKVGNKAALNAYRETGSTTTGIESSTTSQVTKKASASKGTSFLDSHLNGIGKSTSAESSKNKSTWLDEQLKQYDKDANKTTAADTSVAYDTTI